MLLPAHPGPSARRDRKASSADQPSRTHVGSSRAHRWRCLRGNPPRNRRALDMRASPCPSSITSRPSIRTDVPPPASGWSVAGRRGRRRGGEHLGVRGRRMKRLGIDRDDLLALRPPTGLRPARSARLDRLLAQLRLDARLSRGFPARRPAAATKTRSAKMRGASYSPSSPIPPQALIPQAAGQARE